MESGESKRRVVVEDADGEEIVTVVEAVVRRMKGLPDLDNKKSTDAKPVPPSPPSDLQTKVLECYQANGTEPLNCSGIVNAFASCVDRARVASSTSRVQAVSSDIL
ncbi:MICOS complex subunit [Elysia marginata]|uniref:MICOS complex subunit n=1 Tax=Elysia marginata TaxID=1093978 RepID=A0AAV4JJG6_9GAST|nr:MICOS complex subunit [Elysia marginata]